MELTQMGLDTSVAIRCASCNTHLVATLPDTKRGSLSWTPDMPFSLQICSLKPAVLNSA
ncbi:hypothetical protein AB4090_05665 [Acidithiobacillus sp. IBUN Pt1247-S3]|uniref:hypothetical protein n=1 Tax=Acidithiobacillus sp. IBUN Pt1247-S3 TaxID=3166642 RepID=UPI0034E396A3